MKKNNILKWLIICLLFFSLSGCINELEWIFAGAPLGDNKIFRMHIDPENTNLWYVESEHNGIYITRDSGSTWEKYGDGFAHAFEIDPVNPSVVYAIIQNKIFKSNNKGINWNPIYELPYVSSSMLVSKIDSAIYVPGCKDINKRPGKGNDYIKKNYGVFKSTNGGEEWDFYSFNFEEDHMIMWDIEEDPVNGIIYISSENDDHDRDDYHPPFLRSTDSGRTWENIGSMLPWHVIKIQVSPDNQWVYVLTEGAGLYYSKDHGDTWELKYDTNICMDIFIDKKYPVIMYLGDHTYGERNGGVFRSLDRGDSFDLIGLQGKICGSITLNHSGSRLYACSYKSGIYVLKKNIHTPQLISPRDNALLDNGYVGLDSLIWEFDWSDVPDAHKYQLRILHNNADPMEYEVNTSNFTFSNVNNHLEYAYLNNWTWQVRAGTIFGEWSEWSEYRHFDVEPPGMDCSE